MELVGHYIAITEEAGTILMDFACTNKEIFRGIVVSDKLRSISGSLVRVWLYREPSWQAPRNAPYILTQWEEIDDSV